MAVRIDDKAFVKAVVGILQNAPELSGRHVQQSDAKALPGFPCITIEGDVTNARPVHTASDFEEIASVRVRIYVKRANLPESQDRMMDLVKAVWGVLEKDRTVGGMVDDSGPISRDYYGFAREGSEGEFCQIVFQGVKH